MAPCVSHGPLSVGGFLYCGCRSMSDETGESRKFTFVRSVLFSVCFIIYPLLSAGITVISRLS